MVPAQITAPASAPASATATALECERAACPRADWWWPGRPESRMDGRLGGGAHDRALLFFPPAGADQRIAAPLAGHLAGTRFGVLRTPGRGPRHDEPPPPDLAAWVAEVASSIAALPGPPPVLAGHSFGGIVAFAVACVLQARGTPVARLVAIASGPPTDAAARAGWTPERRDAYIERRTAELLRDGAVPRGILQDAASASMIREALATDVRLSVSTAVPVSPLRSPVSLVLARDDRLVAGTAATSGWASVAAGGLDQITVSGGHFFYRQEPAVLARLLTAELRHLDTGWDG